MRIKIINSVLLVGISLFLLSFDLPKYWFKSGSDPLSYDAGIDPEMAHDGIHVATIKSIERKAKGFGTLMQNCLPDKYLGKRIRMTGFIKSKDVDEWAGFWLKIEQANRRDSAVAFDNMQNRPVKGTTEWTKYDIVLDVSSNASKLSYGALLKGRGQIWFENLSFEIVDLSVPTTETISALSSPLKEPQNLDFKN